MSATTAPVQHGEADALVRAAHARAYRYPAEFTGFTASVSWRMDDRSGEAAVTARPGPEIELAGAEDGAWVERELRSIVGHRQTTTYEHGDGRHGKRVAGETSHALGTLVEMDDEYASSYRVAGDEISTVTRTLDGRRFTIVVHERAAMPDGTGLPTSFTVFYWDVETGALTATEAYRDSAVEVDGVFLPASRTIVRGDAEGLSFRQLQLSDHATIAGGGR